LYKYLFIRKYVKLVHYLTCVKINIIAWTATADIGAEFLNILRWIAYLKYFLLLFHRNLVLWACFQFQKIYWCFQLLLGQSVSMFDLVHCLLYYFHTGYLLLPFYCVVFTWLWICYLNLKLYSLGHSIS